MRSVRSIGFGLLGRLPIGGIYTVAVVLFAVQVVMSRCWLAGHAQGPMEALWRRWTYGKKWAAGIQLA